MPPVGNVEMNYSLFIDSLNYSKEHLYRLLSPRAQISEIKIPKPRARTCQVVSVTFCYRTPKLRRLSGKIFFYFRTI